MSCWLSVVKAMRTDSSNNQQLKTNNSLRYIKKVSDFSTYISMGRT